MYGLRFVRLPTTVGSVLLNHTPLFVSDCYRYLFEGSASPSKCVQAGRCSRGAWCLESWPRAWPQCLRRWSSERRNGCYNNLRIVLVPDVLGVALRTYHLATSALPRQMARLTSSA